MKLIIAVNPSVQSASLWLWTGRTTDWDECPGLVLFTSRLEPSPTLDSSRQEPAKSCQGTRVRSWTPGCAWWQGNRAGSWTPARVRSAHAQHYPERIVGTASKVPTQKSWWLRISTMTKTANINLAFLPWEICVWCSWWLLSGSFGEPPLSVFVTHVHKALVVVASPPRLCQRVPFLSFWLPRCWFSTPPLPFLPLWFLLLGYHGVDLGSYFLVVSGVQLTHRLDDIRSLQRMGCV